MNNPTPLRVLLVDDQALFRKEIVSLPGKAPGFSVVGEDSTGREALEKARELQADGRVYAAASQRDAAAPRPTDLSAREQEVLALVAQGKSNKEIGAAIAIAENTVKNHLKSILEKLHLGNRVQAATYAFRQGLAGQGE
jgi:DNA-binding NarL/FixJ family response regulator